MIIHPFCPLSKREMSPHALSTQKVSPTLRIIAPFLLVRVRDRTIPIWLELVCRPIDPNHQSQIDQDIERRLLDSARYSKPREHQTLESYHSLPTEEVWGARLPMANMVGIYERLKTEGESGFESGDQGEPFFFSIRLGHDELIGVHADSVGAAKRFAGL